MKKISVCILMVVIIILVFINSGCKGIDKPTVEIISLDSDNDGQITGQIKNLTSYELNKVIVIINFYTCTIGQAGFTKDDYLGTISASVKSESLLPNETSSFVAYVPDSVTEQSTGLFPIFCYRVESCKHADGTAVILE